MKLLSIIIIFLLSIFAAFGLDRVYKIDTEATVASVAASSKVKAVRVAKAIKVAPAQTGHVEPKPVKTVLTRKEAEPKEELVPALTLELKEGNHALVVDKRASKLYIYGKGLKLVKSYSVVTGKRIGDKRREGDRKTPEGVYFFTGVIDGKKLQSKYGVMALTTDYPNPVDILNKKTGSNIWLHGTDDPARIDLTRDTRGCVVAVDTDVLEIADKIELFDTPIVIVNELLWITKKEASAKRAGVIKTLKGSIDDLPSMERMEIFSHPGGVVASVRVKEGLKLYYLNGDGVVSETLLRSKASGKMAALR